MGNCSFSRGAAISLELKVEPGSGALNDLLYLLKKVSASKEDKSVLKLRNYGF
jgi:hypothetical protein